MPNPVLIKGFTMGTFDKLHLGHLELLRRAREHCDHLTVGAISDDLVASRKGRRPSQCICERTAALAETKWADSAMKITNTDLHHLHRLLGFDILIVGEDWKGKLGEHSAWRTIYLDRTPGISTTQIRGDVLFPLAFVANAVVLTAAALALHWQSALILATVFGVTTAWFIQKLGWRRVADWMNRTTEEPAPWC